MCTGAHSLAGFDTSLRMDLDFILQRILLTIGLGIGLGYAYQKCRELNRLPPGPWGIPGLGYLPFILWKDPIQLFKIFKKKYGKIFSLKLGSFNVVVINDYKLIAQAFSQEVFMGRPAFEVSMLRNHGRKRGILFAEGPTWAEQRRFTLRHLRHFGFGKQREMETLLIHETRELIQFFESNLGKPIDLKGTFNASVLNSLWFICTGSRFNPDDPDFKFCIQNLTENLQRAHLTGPIFFFPWILKHDWIIKGFWSNFLITRDRVQALVKTQIEEHKKSFDPNREDRDFVDALLREVIKANDENNQSSSFYGDEGELNILLVLVDLFLAGAETTSTTLQWAILYMIEFPQVQSRVQAEIKTVMGNSRFPSLEDRPKMIYTEATINEIHRLASIVPFSVYHSTLEGTDFAGYRIPKDTVILANLKDAHYDEEYWVDPTTFRPERFIDPMGEKLVKHEAFIPFSIGKRGCIGETLARDTLFLILTFLLQKFNFQKDPSSPELSIEPLSPTFITCPKPYKVVVHERMDVVEN